MCVVMGAIGDQVSKALGGGGLLDPLGMRRGQREEAALDRENALAIAKVQSGSDGAQPGQTGPRPGQTYRAGREAAGEFDRSRRGRGYGGHSAGGEMPTPGRDPQKGDGSGRSGRRGTPSYRDGQFYS